MQTPDVDGHETVVPGAVPPRGGGRRTRWLVGLVALGLLLAFSVVALVCALLDLADGGWRPVGDAVLVLSVAAVVGGTVLWAVGVISRAEPPAEDEDGDGL